MGAAKLSCLMLLLLPATAVAQPDYFPLETGNQWIYRSSANTVMTLEIARTAEFAGRVYHLLRGLPDADHWLRMDQDGSLVTYDPDGGKEQLWYAFRRPEGEQYATSMPGTCCMAAIIASRKALYQGPVGKFGNALEIEYPGVFQVGIYREFFLPDVGLVHRAQAAGGPAVITWDLIHARIGGSVYLSEPTVSFGLTLDKSVYSSMAMLVRFTLSNTSAEPVSLQFPTSQIYDFVLRNAKGEVVYRWSDGMAFLDTLHSETYGNGEKNFALLVRLAGKAGRALLPGNYVAEAWLTTVGPRTYMAAVSFQIASGSPRPREGQAPRVPGHRSGSSRSHEW